MRGEKRSLEERSFAARCVFCRSLPFSLFLFFFVFSLSLSLSLFLFRFKTLLPAPGLASDVFHQINSRSMREYALLFTPRRRVCIISFIIQLALNSTLFRSHDRSFRPSSSFFPRILPIPGKAPCSTSRARAGCSVPPRDHLCYSSSPYLSSCQRFRFSFTRGSWAIFRLFLFSLREKLTSGWIAELRSSVTEVIVFLYHKYNRIKRIKVEV